MNAEALFPHELETIGLKVRESKVPNGYLRMFGARPLVRNQIIGTYYESSIETNSPLVLKANRQFKLKLLWPYSLKIFPNGLCN